MFANSLDPDQGEHQPCDLDPIVIIKLSYPKKDPYEGPLVTEENSLHSNMSYLG